ncbi:urease accessory protein UreF [Roseibium sp. TrichSKD4]|uniref:urease accessory protein UreF n=1 Tax=Roseibium sp. TrichSKD4 TaxID=744980 RepID=UPI0001E56DF4|nr:urease accessory protein UreF [Roseibium sp. TrichSKD4]EFO31995.1 urease accessory protein UreF [Roseibium sp. TrichSKD4]
MSLSAHHIMAWMSPAFPTGAFAYSHGLEQAIHCDLISDRNSLEDWLSVLLRQGGIRNDAILLVHAFKGEDVRDLCEALAGSKERHKETMAQGSAFAKTASALLETPIPPAPLPVTVGKAAAMAGVPVEDLLPLYIHAFIANLISAAIRLVPLGQTDGQIVLQNLFAHMDALAEEALAAGLDDLGTCSIGADLAAMKHEDMTTRIFKS